MTPLDPIQLLLAAGFFLLSTTAGVLIVQGWGLAGSYPTLVGQAIIVILGIVLWPALLLAEIGHFSLFNLNVILLVLCLVIGFGFHRRRRPRQPLPRPKFSWPDGILVAILIGAALLFGRPAELIVGGEDPGVYMNTGIHIARTGAIEIKDEVLAAIPAELSQDRLYTSPDYCIPRVAGSVFPGFYVVDSGEGRIVPQFFHLFPTAIAIMVELGGVRLALYTTPLLALASLFMLYLLGRELAGRSVGLLAAGLLGLNISQVWFARLSFSDVVLQFWLLAGLWTLSVLIDRERKGHDNLGLIAILSGGCFGMAHLTKLDSYVVPVIVVGYVGVSWLLEQFGRRQALLTGTYLLLVLHASVHAYVFSAYYVYVMFSAFAGLLQVAAITLVAGIGILIAISRHRSRLVAWLKTSSRYQRFLRALFVVVILVGSPYLYFVRPLLASLGDLTAAQIADRGQMIQTLSAFSIEPEKHDHLGQPTRTFVEEGIVRMGWYLTPLGVWLGIAGLLIWSLLRPDPKALPFLGVALVASAIVFHKGAIRSDFFWAFKRFVPLVVPAFMLLIAYAIGQLGLAQSRVASRILPLLLVSVLVTAYVVEDLHVISDVEYQGAIDQISDLNELFARDGVILYEDSASAHGIGTPLRFVHGLTVYRVAVEQINSAPMQQMIEKWLDENTAVYWVTPTDTKTDAYGSVRWIAARQIEWRVRATSWERLPKRVSRFRARLQIYQFESAQFVAPKHLLNANFGDQIFLLGYDLDESSVVAGEVLGLDLYWYAPHKLDIDYTVFAHVLEDNTTMRGQWDGPPMDGTRPTSSWIPGEIIHDRLEIPISPETPPGSYPLSVGLYEWPSITRLPLLEDGQPVNDQVLISKIQVRGAQ